MRLGDRAALLKAAVGNGVTSRSELLAGAVARRQRAKMVFAFDATASRSGAWNAARRVTDALFQALPGELDVALAVHGGSRVHTFTDFLSDPAALRDRANGISCEAGGTQLVEIMERAGVIADLKVLLYIGDSFEESVEAGRKAADRLKAHGIRMIVLHDLPKENRDAAATFADLTGRTGGCVLPFDAHAPAQLREMLQAIAVLAVGGVKLLQEKRKSLPAASLLLQHVK